LALRMKMLAAGAATVAIPALTLAAGVPAANASTVRAANLNCYTGKHANDELTGYALCSNPGTSTVQFRVHLVCGWAPDVSGDWRTLPPGGSSQSTAHCAFYSSGIGQINVETR